MLDRGSGGVVGGARAHFPPIACMTWVMKPARAIIAQPAGFKRGSRR
jgi:hypothetical protein